MSRDADSSRADAFNNHRDGINPADCPASMGRM